MNNDTKARAFTLAEMLVTILICSVVLVVMAPMITTRRDGGVADRSKQIEITYGSKYCNIFDSTNNVCRGVFEIPADIDETMDVTVVAGGGGGGGGTSSGTIEYKESGVYEFTVPEGVDEIEATLVGGGAGGGAGNVSEELKSISWTHDGKLNRTYVGTKYVSSNLTQRAISTTDVTKDGEAQWSSADTKYIFSNRIMAAISGGGGGGGRGFNGAGGGGGAARYETVEIQKNKNYTIHVARGGMGHKCCGLLGTNAPTSGGSVAQENGTGYAGCGGGASYISDSENYLLAAAGGGGGAWGVSICDGRNGDSVGTIATGAIGGRAEGGGYCSFPNMSLYVTGGGYGALPGGGNGQNGICSASLATYEVPGAIGGASLFGKPGEFAEIFDNPLRHGQGYGAGGCGGGWQCKILLGQDCPGPSFTGNGAPGFVAVSYHEIKNGGGGGGSGSIVPNQRYRVTPGEKITVVVGEGGEGGSAAFVSGSFAFAKGQDGQAGKPSMLKRGNSIIVMTGNQNNCSYGACSGKSSGDSGTSGRVFKGGTSENNFNTSSLGYPTSEFYTGSSQYAGGSTSKPSSYNKDMRGGDGGKVIISKIQTCQSGKGASMSNNSNINASGYGGCGGGGGYASYNGGRGAGGYVKITWNPDNKGRGGGGAAGNSIKRTVRLSGSMNKVDIQIGNGGEGGIISYSGNTERTSQKGGDTIFGYAENQFKLSVGGGNGGDNVKYLNNTLTNGLGGISPTLCALGTSSGLSCFNGDSGSDASSVLSGAGASTIYGAGGFPVKFGNGNSASSYGAGGSGGGIKINTSPTEAPSQGGSGASGKIIVEWK